MLYQGTRWVARVARLRTCTTDEGRDGFVAAFASRNLTASASRLSRWEYGQSPGSHRLLRAYEEGGGLPPYLLFAINDRQRRILEDNFAATSSIEVTSGVVVEDIYEILDRAVAGDPVDGSDWYVLAAYAAAHGYFYLTPENTRLVARRLINELARSQGAGYLLRFEALHLFASMARVDTALISELLTMITTEETGFLGDAVSLILRASPQVGRALALKLRDAESAAVQQAYTWFADIERDRSPRPEPPVEKARVVHFRELLSQALPAWANARLEVEVTTPLLDTALGGRSRLRRHQASLLLMATEVGDALGGPLLDAFEGEQDPRWRTRLAHLHEYFGAPSDPERVAALALAEDDPEIRRALWNARGHAPVRIEPCAGVLSQLQDRDAQAAVAAALGMSGSVDEALLADPAVAGAHRLLGWWHQQGPALAR